LSVKRSSRYLGSFLNYSSSLMPQLFIDLDGVLADFNSGVVNLLGYEPELLDRGVAPDSIDDERIRINTTRKKDMWRRLSPKSSVSVSSEFFATLDFMPGAEKLWEVAKKHNAVVLTGCPEGGWAQTQKVLWCSRKLGLDPDAFFHSQLCPGCSCGEERMGVGSNKCFRCKVCCGDACKGWRGSSEKQVRIITCTKRDKGRQALSWLEQEGRAHEGAVLVDDLLEQSTYWAQDGRHVNFSFVHHVDVDTSLSRLREMGFE